MTHNADSPATAGSQNQMPLRLELHDRRVVEAWVFAARKAHEERGRSLQRLFHPRDTVATTTNGGVTATVRYWKDVVPTVDSSGGLCLCDSSCSEVQILPSAVENPPGEYLSGELAVAQRKYLAWTFPHRFHWGETFGEAILREGETLLDAGVSVLPAMTLIFGIHQIAAVHYAGSTPNGVTCWSDVRGVSEATVESLWEASTPPGPQIHPPTPSSNWTALPAAVDGPQRRLLAVYLRRD